MKRTVLILTCVFCLLLFGCSSNTGVVEFDQTKPEQVVNAFITHMKNEEYTEASKLLIDDYFTELQDSPTRETWVEYVSEAKDVYKITDYKVSLQGDIISEISAMLDGTPTKVFVVDMQMEFLDGSGQEGFPQFVFAVEQPEGWMLTLGSYELESTLGAAGVLSSEDAFDIITGKLALEDFEPEVDPYTDPSTGGLSITLDEDGEIIVK